MLPRHMDTEFNAHELDRIERYVNNKEKAAQELMKLQAQALQERQHGP